MLACSYPFEALGTQWNIETEHEISHDIRAVIETRIEKFDSTYSRFRNDSLISLIAKKKGEYEFPSDANKLFTFYKDLYDLSGGKVTPLIGDALTKAGYDVSYSFRPRLQEALPDWDTALLWQAPRLKTNQPVILDFGAAGKGYLVDIIASILDKNNVDEYVIDASGDLKHKGSSQNIVGLEHPFDPKSIIGTIDVKNKSLCASASNRRVWGSNMHHIFDPHSLNPTWDVVASWVIADETMVADGLATALFFIDPSALQPHYSYEYARIHKGGSIDYSPAFEGQLF